MGYKKYLKFGKFTKDCPPSLLKKVAGVNRKHTLKSTKRVLTIIREEFNPNKYKTSLTNDFKESRFLSVQKIFKKRQRSCGSYATVVAAVMRKLNTPTKLIDGFFIKNGVRKRHAWNEIYLNKKWIPIDLTRKSFRVGRRHWKKTEWLDWSQLREK